MANNILISIGAGVYQKGVILTAQQMGFQVLVVDIDPHAVSLEYADQVVIADAHDADATLTAIQEGIDVSLVVGVVTQAARGCIATTAAVAQAFGCLHLDLPVATRTLNKTELIQKFHPQVILGSLDREQADLTQLTFPLLVKSDEGSGSTGIQVMRNPAELKRFLTADQQQFPVICHQLLQGRHFGVLGIATQSGYCFYGVLEQFLDDTFHIQQTCFPATLTSREAIDLIKAAKKYLEEISFNLGPFQVELIQEDDGGIYLAEIEASIVGSYISERMIPEAGNNDFIRDSIMTLTVPGFTPKIRMNEFQIRNEFPNTPSNPESHHLFSRTELSGSGSKNELTAKELQ